MVINKIIDAESRQIIHDHLMGLCLDGHCYAFAIAMHKSLGWQMIGLMQGEVIRHAAVIEKGTSGIVAVK